MHGDFHPGNLRGDGRHLRLLDWGDSGVGHPLLDETAFCQRLSAADRAIARTAFEQQLAGGRPGVRPHPCSRPARPGRGAAGGGGVPAVPRGDRAVRAGVPPGRPRVLAAPCRRARRRAALADRRTVRLPGRSTHPRVITQRRGPGRSRTPHACGATEPSALKNGSIPCVLAADRATIQTCQRPSASAIHATQPGPVASSTRRWTRASRAADTAGRRRLVIPTSSTHPQERSMAPAWAPGPVPG